MFGDLPQVLAAIRSVRRQLAEAQTLAKVKSLRDKAEAIREYAKRASLGLKTCNLAAQAKLDAERKAGRMLGRMNLSHGGRPKTKTRSRRAISLRRLGITKSQSSRWQLAASVPEKAFGEYLAKTRKARQEITTEDLLRLAWELRGVIKTARKTAKARRGGDDPDEAPDPTGLAQTESEVLEKMTEMLHIQELVAGVLDPVLSGEQENLAPFERRFVKAKLADILQTLREAVTK